MTTKAVATNKKPDAVIKNMQIAKNGVLDVIKEFMQLNLDYGEIPGVKGQTLFAAGADKLAKFLGVVPDYTTESETIDPTTGFVYYRVKCRLIDQNKTMESGVTIYGSSAIKVCHSFEKKYRERWDKQVNRKVPSSAADMVDKANTIISMAEKRAFVAAIKTEAMTRELFKEGYEVDELTGEILSDYSADETETAAAIKRLFTATNERGFSSDEVKRFAYNRYHVESITELGLEELEELLTGYVTNWAVIKKGEKRRKIESDTTNKSSDKNPSDNQEGFQNKTNQKSENDAQQSQIPLEGEVMDSGLKGGDVSRCMKCKKEYDKSKGGNGAFCQNCVGKVGKE